MNLAPILSLLAAAASPSPSAGLPQSGRPVVTAAAVALIQSDWVLANWALKYFDRNGDLLIDADEARAAADAFRKIADTNHDGRITPDEYRAARALILSRD